MIEGILMVVGGIVLLGLGGEAFVRGAVSVARICKLSLLTIGLTVVAFGTSAPELMVSMQAAWRGQVDIAVGNVVGSNIANILLVLGVVALIKPIRHNGKAVFRDGLVMIAVSLLFVSLAFRGLIDLPLGIFLLLLLGFYIGMLYRHKKSGLEDDENAESADTRGVDTRNADTHSMDTPSMDTYGAGIHRAGGRKNESIADRLSGVEEHIIRSGLKTALPVLVLGGFAIIWGADFLVTGAVALARIFAVPEVIIGISLVAFGTSLPELAISLLAAWRGHVMVAVGNIIGSNIFNILLILGATALITPIPISQHILQLDIWVMLLASVVAVLLLYLPYGISRATGFMFLAAYVVYIAFLYAA